MQPQRAVTRTTSHQNILGFYAGPAAMTVVAQHRDAIAALPCDVAKLARIVRGLAIHQYMAPAYGFKVPDARAGEAHIRHVEVMLDRLLAIDAAPLHMTRPVEKRLIGVCHHFALLMVAFLRAQGVPARFRCGFGAYFNAPYLEEHLVCEYWNAAQGRWILVDAQLDDVWQRELKFGFDPLDVPRTEFLVAADAWTRCRSGQLDPAKAGIFVGNQRGLWFIAGELVRDLAALNGVEMLPWDCWGIIPRSSQPLGDGQLAFFDRLAALTAMPDGSFDELRAMYDGHDDLRVPPQVFNALLNRMETV
jgi:hypothetical protein